jgi:uncharacterized protein (TIGR04255 family)
VTDLPSYRQPPVTEVAVGLQYSSSLNLSLRDLFRIHASFEDRYPGLEEYAPLPKIVPAEDAQTVQFAFGQMTKAVLPRLWFIGESPTELVQLQHDRFVFNWRKTAESDPYLRFDHHVRPAFVDAHRRLLLGLEEADIAEPAIESIDVAYVNAIPLEAGDSCGAVLRILQRDQKRGFLPEATGLQMQLIYSIPDLDAGSLTITIQSAERVEDRAPTILMHLNVRAMAAGDFEQALVSIGVARRWIVNGFTDLTTDEMHERWILE